MRLINVHTRQLESFIRNIPQYAILSHTWQREEVSFKDIQSPAREALHGWKKISKCMDEASRDGWNYVWVDTCCIDKSDSTELGEAINSMFQWYKDAAVCYAYLEDISPSAEENDTGPTPKAFEFSHWFSRGWTLQELLAPCFVIFFDCRWQQIGTRESRREEIARASRIEPQYLADFSQASVATKFSWASRRSTTRVEDEAYCLLGLFGIHMPLIYGEGSAAFRRLQAQIIQENDDDSIFAWRCWDSECGLQPQDISAFTLLYELCRNHLLIYCFQDPEAEADLLAPSAECFYHILDVKAHLSNSERTGFSLSNSGLAIRGRLFHLYQDDYVFFLNCYCETPGFPLREVLCLTKISDVLEYYQVRRPSISKHRFLMDIAASYDELQTEYKDIRIALQGTPFKGEEDDAEPMEAFPVRFSYPNEVRIIKVCGRGKEAQMLSSFCVSEAAVSSGTCLSIGEDEYLLVRYPKDSTPLQAEIIHTWNGTEESYFVDLYWAGRMPRCGIWNVESTEEERYASSHDDSLPPHAALSASSLHRVVVQLRPESTRPHVNEFKAVLPESASINKALIRVHIHVERVPAGAILPIRRLQASISRRNSLVEA